ncbi:MAG: hypothetical protein K6G10_07045 [Butyrivibrio sp.]|nr:hypothetical protein [Butyrivibrio sp.]
MFYIFLDIDGVLNKESDWKIKYSIDKSCVNALKDISMLCEKQYGDIRIILSSTWKAGISKDGSSIQIKNLQEALATVGLAIFESTPMSNKGRQAEIEYFIRRNSVQHYLVIDDDLSLFEEPKRLNLLVSDYKKGLTKDDVKTVKKMLKEGL